MKNSSQKSPRGLLLNPILPEHFAEQVLDFETELDLDCNLNTISKLMELYSSAIEHYESKSDPKYLHYQERLNSLLSRKDVITLLNVKSPTSITRLKPSEIVKKMQGEIALRQKLRSHQVHLFINNFAPEHQDIENILTKHRSESHLASKNLKENLRNQENNELNQRVIERRRRSGTPVNGIRPVSTNSIRALKIDKYQEDLEKILENCVEERNSKVKEIKKKYKEEIKQIKMIGGEEGIMKKLIDEMKKNLKSEVNEVDKMVREKKLKMIEEIKSNYY